MKKALNIIHARLLELKLNENILCSEFWRKIIALNKDFNEADCWDLLTEHFDWLINSKTATTNDVLSWFDENELNKHFIFSKGKHIVKDHKAIGIGTADIFASGHSKILLFDKANCVAFDSTFVKGFNDSTFDVTECVGEAFNDCKAVAGYMSKVEAWDNSFITAKDYSFVIKHDKAMVAETTRAHVVSQ